MLSLIIGLGFLIIYWIIEYHKHQFNRKQIPNVIHVNGTRGKTSVTRLIAAGLRAGNKKTIAKTTGSAASLIYENGKERPIIRYFTPNIKEQIKIIKFAAERKVDYLVLECMAITPEYQWVTEHEMVKSNIGVITNSRLEHLDLMGPGIRNVTLSLCNTLPRDGKAFTAEKKMYPLIDKVAQKRGINLEYADAHNVHDEEMRGFNYIAHKENVALALKVCEECGVNRETALKGMYEAKSDVGAARVMHTEINDTNLFFAHSFAANDPHSTEVLIKHVKNLYSQIDKAVIVLSTRADRIFRSKQLIEMLNDVNFYRLYLIGEETDTIYKYALNKKHPKEKLHNIGWVQPEKLLDEITKIDSNRILILGIGNIHGNGEIILNYFENEED